MFAPESTARPNGFVQILVLVSLVTISGILLVVLSNSVQLTTESKVLDQSVEGEMLASSAIRRVEAAIEDPNDDLETKILAAGSAYPLQIAGTTVDVSIEGESGKINPALADPAIITAYLAPLTIDPDQRRELTADLDQARTTKDAAGAIDALDRHLLPAVTYDQLQSDFSMLNETSGIDPTSANDRVLAALPDLGPSRVGEVHDLRTNNPSGLHGLSAYFTAAQPVFTIVATIHRSATERYSLRVPIEISTAGRIIPLDGFL